MANNKKYKKQELENMSLEELRILDKSIPQTPSNTQTRNTTAYCTILDYESGNLYGDEGFFYSCCNLCPDEGYQKLDIAPTDVSGDGIINVIDIVEMTNLIFSQNPAFGDGMVNHIQDPLPECIIWAADTNEDGLVNVVDAQTSAQNFIHKFNGGGVVEHFNEGGMVGKELVYSIRKFTTEKVVKGDEIERTKTRERTTGAIQLEDLYENQDQILSQLPEGTTIESIVNGTSGIDPQVLYPILQSSDAQMASTAKERAIDMQMMQDNNLINSDNTVKGFSSYDQNFKGGGSVKGFNKGGEVPGSGNNDTVPAMFYPGEFVMSKGEVHK